MIRNEKWEEILIHCYHEMYKKSTPKLNFKKAFKEKKLDPGFYDKYSIDQKDCDEIINETIKKYKITGYQRQILRNSIYLGVSPKFKKYDVSGNDSKKSV